MNLVSVFCAIPQNACAVRLGFAIGSLVLLIGSLLVLIVSGWIPISFLGLVIFAAIKLEYIRTVKTFPNKLMQPFLPSL
ncbi:MAG: hypothetical protein KJN87_07245 [Desulfofustis sp.]|nr:hypothetical protein [Desulfofustis sp.]